MPDWFYRTVTQPLLFRVPAVPARDFTLGFLGRLARLPFGPAVIDFLGHMRADPRLRQSFLGIDFPTAVGLGPGLDAKAAALPALARFGFGFLEVGPVTPEGTAASQSVARRPIEKALWSPDPPASLSLAVAAPRLAEASRLGLPVIARLGAPECRRMIEELAPHVHLFSLDTLRTARSAGWSSEEWTAHLRTVLDASPRPVLLCVPADLDPEAGSFVETAVSAGVSGLLVDGSVAAGPDGRLIGAPAREPAREQVRRWRSRYGKDLFLIASGGVHEPADALALQDAGADLVYASGVVFLLPVLWGFRNGSAWLWWSMLTAGVSAYAAALAIHYAVGYRSLVHLLPAFAGLGILLLGLGLSYSYLCGPPREPVAARALTLPSLRG